MKRATHQLFEPLDLPNGTQVKNRLIKSAMSDMLADGRGNPTPEQIALYKRWAEGGVGASIVGEVQPSPHFPEAAGNLVLDPDADAAPFRALAEAGRSNNSALWLQLGSAGALTPADIGIPVGPSKLDLDELKARELSVSEIRSLPLRFAEAAARAEQLGFAGVQIHAAHGFLLSQFLSPLFNRREDAYGGTLTNRMRLLVETIDAVCGSVGARFTVSLKLNSSDGIDGGLSEEDALQIIGKLDKSGLDLIDISGGSYFPGASSSSDQRRSGPYFLEFAHKARSHTDIPLMATGGFKTRLEAENAVASGAIDAVGLARLMVLEPSVPDRWRKGQAAPDFPTFSETVPGGVTAWYTMAIRQMASGAGQPERPDSKAALESLEKLVCRQTQKWQDAFGLDDNS